MVLMNGLKQQTPGRHMTGCVTHTAGAQEVRVVTPGMPLTIKHIADNLAWQKEKKGENPFLPFSLLPKQA